ncbi:hypothetical protein DFAR_2810021 [Desulfarculales bacterium]
MDRLALALKKRGQNSQDAVAVCHLWLECFTRQGGASQSRNQPLNNWRPTSEFPRRSALQPRPPLGTP